MGAGAGRCLLIRLLYQSPAGSGPLAEGPCLAVSRGNGFGFRGCGSAAAESAHRPAFGRQVCLRQLAGESIVI